MQPTKIKNLVLGFVFGFLTTIVIVQRLKIAVRKYIIRCVIDCFDDDDHGFLIVLFGWPICSNWIMIMCCDQSDPCCLWINVFEITFNFRRPPIITYYYLLDSHDPHAQLVFVSVLVNAKNVSIAIMKD